MKRVLWMAVLLVLTLPMAAYANTIDFGNAGGTVSLSSMGGLIISSTINSVTGLSGFTSGTLSITTGAPTSGTLDGTATLGPGSLTITSNVFTGTFAFNSATWTLQPFTVAGNHQYNLVLGFANGNGSSTQIAIVTGGGVFTTMADVKSGDTIVATVVPEPATLGLLGTGLVAIGGLVRRKLRFG